MPPVAEGRKRAQVPLERNIRGHRKPQDALWKAKKSHFNPQGRGDCSQPFPAVAKHVALCGAGFPTLGMKSV